MRAVDERAEGVRVRRLGADPVEAAVPGHSLDDREDGEERPHDDHGPEGAVDLGARPVDVVADDEEGGDGAELQRLAQRGVRGKGQRQRGQRGAGVGRGLVVERRRPGRDSRDQRVWQRRRLEEDEGEEERPSGHAPLWSLECETPCGTTRHSS